MTPFSDMYFPMFQILVLQVSSSDTLASIAAKFDTTTSELMKLNKLMSQMIFPGQVQHLGYIDNCSVRQSDERLHQNTHQGNVCELGDDQGLYDHS